MKDARLSVIIPVYNELNTILELIRRVQDEVHEKEIIVVDDGSTDGTRELLAKAKADNIKVILHERNLGKGAAIKTGIGHISGDIVIIQDADLEYYPDEYGILIKPIVDGKADVVYGTRFLGAHRVFHFYHYCGNLLINLIANSILDANLTDLMTGYKVFKARVLKKLVLEAKGFGVEVEITVEIFKRKMRIYEVPISYEGRGYDEGKKIRWKDFFVCVYWLIRSVLRGIDVSTETLIRMQIMDNNNAWVYRKLQPFMGKKILEMGSGLGTISRYLVEYSREIVLTDMNEEYIEYLGHRFIGNPSVRIIRMDLNRIEAELKEQFDTIVGINILEHIEDDTGLLRKIKPLLASDGHLLLLVPAHKVLFGKLDDKLRHYRRYSRKELIKKLEDCGFAVERVSYMNFLAAIGWFVEYKIFQRSRMPSFESVIADKLVPFVSAVERCVDFPFGISLFVVAKHK